MVQPYRHLEALSRPSEGRSRTLSPPWCKHLTALSGLIRIAARCSGVEGVSVREPPPIASAGDSRLLVYSRSPRRWVTALGSGVRFSNSFEQRVAHIDPDGKQRQSGPWIVRQGFHCHHPGPAPDWCNYRRYALEWCADVPLAPGEGLSGSYNSLISIVIRAIAVSVGNLARCVHRPHGRKPTSHGRSRHFPNACTKRLAR